MTIPQERTLAFEVTFIPERKPIKESVFLDPVFIQLRNIVCSQACPSLTATSKFAAYTWTIAQQFYPGSKLSVSPHELWKNSAEIIGRWSVCYFIVSVLMSQSNPVGSKDSCSFEKVQRHVSPKELGTLKVWLLCQVANARKCTWFDWLGWHAIENLDLGNPAPREYLSFLRGSVS